MNEYFATQDSRPTPYIADGLRKYSASGNPRYIIQDTISRGEDKPVKVELTSDVQKTLDQTKEEMAASNPRKRKRKSVKKPKRYVKRKTAAKTKKRSFAKKKKSGKQVTVFSKNGRKKH
jgi:hypothetical protein